MLPNSSNVIMAAERACELSEKPARVVPSTSQQAGLLALVELDPDAERGGERATRLGEALGRRSPPAGSRRRPATTRRDASGAATRSASSTARSSPGAAPARRWRRRSSASPRSAEIVTVIGGEGAPIPLAEIDAHVPDGVELEIHDGGQPSWWWLLAAQ